MKVLLKAKVPGVGDAGQIVNVSDGYYRNFLKPRNLAAEATSVAVRTTQARDKAKDAAAEKALREAEALAERLRELTLTFGRKAGEGDHLYGSVTAADFLEALSKKGLEVPKKEVAMKPIKTVGEYEVPIKLHPKVTATVRVVVRKEE